MGLPSNYLRVAICMQDTTSGAIARTYLWYKKDTGTDPTAANITDYADEFHVAYETGMAGFLPTACNHYNTELVFRNGSTQIDGGVTVGPTAGTVSGDYLPEEDALCIQKRTSQTGRSKRGRNFFPFVPESFQNKGALSGAPAVAAAQALAQMIKSDVTAGGAVWKAQHLDFQHGTLIPITQTRYHVGICSRRDRRYPKRDTVINVA